MKKNQMIIILVVVLCVLSVVIAMTTTTSDQDSAPVSAPDSEPVSEADTVSAVEFDESIPGREPPFGRYVRFSFHEGAPAKYILAPKEIKVFDMQGVNVALNKPVTVHGHHSIERFPKENAVDGDENTIWHSRTGGDTDWIEIDLGKDIKISKIIITQGAGTTVYNGVASGARMSGGGPDSGDKGSYITIKGTEPDSIWKTEDIKRVSSIYVYDFTKETGKWETEDIN